MKGLFLALLATEGLLASLIVYVDVVGALYCHGSCTGAFG
jgi:hypothetical protein